MPVLENAVRVVCVLSQTENQYSQRKTEEIEDKSKQ